MIRILLPLLIWCTLILVCAQTDTTPENKIDSLLMKPKGIIGQLAQNLLADTTDEDKIVQRNDLPYRKYEGFVIRHIIVQSPKFGQFTNDTGKSVNKKLTRLANNLHYRTRGWVVRNHLFFKENDKLSAYLLGTNERYLRDLPFLQEARIRVQPIRGSRDSVDLVVRTKDVLSVGGNFKLRSANSVLLGVKEDNFLGWGDRYEIQTLFDNNRRNSFGYGAQYLKRNIMGSFIDGSAGYLNFERAFNTGRREEQVAFARFVKPLVNPYMKWTYAMISERHSTSNMYNSDSLYKSDLAYRYRIHDAWLGYNLSSNNTYGINEFSRLRFLLSARVFDQNFNRRPDRYSQLYHYSYADLFAILGSISVFQLNFYKTQYVYGFGRKEDLPDGIEAAIMGGYTRKGGRERLYTALNFKRYYLTRREGYFNYTLTLGAHFHKMKAEDISLLGNLDYFTRIRYLGPKWKQRTFFNASFTRQYNNSLDEPIFLESIYGLRDFTNNNQPGLMRATAKAESVFFSPWSVLFFRFAPFVFGSATMFRFHSETGLDSRLYSAIGGGVRTRNESLIFGTIELRGVYYPRKDMLNNRYSIQLNTNLRYKYDQNFIRRPEFVSVNY